MATSDTLVDASPSDLAARPLIDALQHEYATRYRAHREDSDAAAAAELARYPAELFSPPEGAFVLLLRGSETIGGGGFKRKDERTAEFKRIWTHADLRRQGLARRVVDALELRALKQGYRRIYLTTGFKQPEAWALYTHLGYTPLFDRSIAPEVHLVLPFGKDLIEPERTDTLDDLRPLEPLGFNK